MSSTKEGLEKLKKRFNKANGWRYGGGDRKREYTHGIDEWKIVETPHSRFYENHLRPFLVKEKICEPGFLPKHKEACICEHHISENCFIYRIKEDGKGEIRVIGNCCIKKFDLSGKHCQICDSVHNNRKNNICNECRWLCVCGNKKQKISSPLCVKCKLINDNSRVYISVPFSNKEYAKQNGAKWDNTKKSWYYTGDLSNEKKDKLQKEFRLS